MSRERDDPWSVAARSFRWGWSREADNAVAIVIGVLALPFLLLWLLINWVVSLFRDEEAYRQRKELAEAQKLLDEARSLHEATLYASASASDDFAVEAGTAVCRRSDFMPTQTFAAGLHQAIQDIVVGDGLIFGLPRFDGSTALSLGEGVALRAALKRKLRFLADHERLTSLVRTKLIDVFDEITTFLPPSAYVDERSDEEDHDDEEGVSPSLYVSLIDLCESPATLIERVIIAIFDDEIANAGLLDRLRMRFERNLCEASGIAWAQREASTKSLIFPTDARGQSPRKLVQTYLAGTPFADFFALPLPFSIPFPARFEHTLIVGGTGHGKTQLMQLLIHHDLMQTAEDGRSVVIIDSQGDLLRTISHLAHFSPRAERSLADKLLIIDPNDVEHPACLNMFDWKRDRFAGYAPADRERLLNGAIELYEYLFGALLGAELTQRQGVIFKYLARLLLEIPGATIQTLRELMENGEPFRPYMERLPGSARSFFATRFFDRSFNETKKQILTRLWGVLSNATFERMFSHPRNKVDMFEATGSGKIILVNTAKDLLKQDGCAIFGRFVIALLAQAAMERATLPAHRRTPTFVYIDEAQDYFDENVEQLLNQARKYRIGMVLAHQNLDQLAPGLRASVMASTSVKFAGGVSSKDAHAFASEMRCDAEFVHGMRKHAGYTEFACFVRNLTPHALEAAVPLGFVESQPTLSDSEYEAAINVNRSRYCATTAEIEALLERPREWPAPKNAETTSPAGPIPRRPSRPPEVPPQPTPMPHTQMEPTVDAPVVSPAQPSPRRQAREVPAMPPMGRGGKKHQYLQQLLKSAAEEKGFRATIEEPILDGAGRVDLSLVRGDRRIACEISVTSDRDHELGNVEKCLAAGYQDVFLVASPARHLATIRTFIVRHIEAIDAEHVRFMLPEDFIAFLESLAVPETTETTVRGYRVKVTKQPLSPEEAAIRRQAIAKVIARSMTQAKDEP